MLVALDAEQSVITLTHTLSRTALQKLREVQSFFCPQCKEPLVLKIGHVKIPHFAHQKNSSCDSFFTEGESKMHLLGKQQLYMWFQRLALDVQLEPYLSDLQQRPDLLVAKKQVPYAIEFQCSRLSQERFVTRTVGYEAHAIAPVWLLSTPSEKYKQQGIIKISINHFQRLFLKDRQLPYLVTYDVDSQTFYYISHLCLYKGQQYFGLGQAIPLAQQVFPFYVPRSVSFEQFQMIMTRYQQENSRHLQGYLLLSRAGVNDALLRAIYELKLDREALPRFVGVYIKGQEHFSKPAVEWQILLLFFIQVHQFALPSMTKQKILYFLEWAGFVVTEEARMVVTRYVQLLVQCKIANAQSDIQPSLFIRALYNELFAID